MSPAPRDLDPADRHLLNRAVAAVHTADPAARNWAHKLWESDPLEQTFPSGVRRVAFFQAALLLRKTTTPEPTAADVHPVADELEEIHIQDEAGYHYRAEDSRRAVG